MRDKIKNTLNGIGIAIIHLAIFPLPLILIFFGLTAKSALLTTARLTFSSLVVLMIAELLLTKKGEVSFPPRSETKFLLFVYTLMSTYYWFL